MSDADKPESLDFDFAPAWAKESADTYVSRYQGKNYDERTGSVRVGTASGSVRLGVRVGVHRAGVKSAWASGELRGAKAEKHPLGSSVAGRGVAPSRVASRR